jgi:hypothetical protein
LVLSNEQIAAARAGDPVALAELDACGLLVGADETAAEYATRLESLEANLGNLEAALKDSGVYEIEDVRLEPATRVPARLFDEPNAKTKGLYGFAMRWVPGFYIKPLFSWLFAGCAYYFFPDFLAFFIVHKAFLSREKWLIYHRDELLAHEMCHVARVGLFSVAYEEHMAYRTSTSRFRRNWGGVFHSTRDSLGILTVVGLLLVSTVLAPVVGVLWLPTPFWIATFGFAAGLVGRHAWYRSRLARAARNLAACGVALPDSVLFRCTDAEIRALGGFGDADDVRAWLAERVGGELRWRVIQARFLGDLITVGNP